MKFLFFFFYINNVHLETKDYFFNSPTNVQMIVLKKQYQHLRYNSSDMLRCSHTIMASLRRNMSELF
jgi:hypothetical protein